jgi:putative PEP-CTERM system TPR-repeat lipoprotein
MPILKTLLFILFISISNTYAKSTDELYEEALSSFNKSEYDQSIIILKNIISENPKHLSGRILLGRSLLLSRQFKSAENQFRQALIDGADRSKIITLLGQSLLFQGKYERLLGSIVLDANSINNVEILSLRGRAYFELDQFDLARDSYNNAIRIAPNKPTGYIGNAIVELKSGYISKGDEWLDKALALNAQDAEALQLKGDVLFRQDNLIEAKDFLNQSLNINENSIRTRLLLAEIYIAETELDKALEHIKFVLELEPDYPNVNMLYAFVLVKLDRKIDAQKVSKNISSYLSKIDENDLNKSPSLRFILGTSLYLQESWENAYGHLNFYAQKYPGHEQSHVMVAELDIRFKRYNAALKALSHYTGESKSVKYWLLKLTGLVKQSEHFSALNTVEQALEYYPTEIRLLEYKVKLLIANDNVPAAIVLLDELYQQGKVSDELAFLLGQLQLSVNELNNAYIVANKLVASQPENPVYLSLSAGIDSKMGQSESAQNKLIKAINLSPNMIQLYLNLHYVYLQQGKAGLAAKTLNQAHELSPKDSFIIAKLAALAEQVHNLDAANKWRFTLYKLAPKELNNVISLADNLIKLKQAKIALDLLQPLRAYNRLNVKYLSRLAASYVSLKMCGEAENVLGILYGLSFDSPEQLAVIAKMYMECGRYEQAHKSLESAEKLKTENIKVQLTRSQWLIEVKQAKLALKALQPLVKKSNIKALGLQVRAYEDLGYNNDAIKAARQLYEKYPIPINAHRLFLQLKKNNKVKEGFLVLENYLQKKDNINLYRVVAFEYLKIGDLTQAEVFFTTLAKKYKQASAYRQLAIIKSGQGMIKEALELAKNAYDLDSNSPSISATYGWLLVRSGQAQQGLPYLRFANARDGRQPTLMFRLAETLLILKQPEQAKTLFEQAVAYDFPDKEKALRRLKEL